jgi:hypothetical protein
MRVFLLFLRQPAALDCVPDLPASAAGMHGYDIVNRRQLKSGPALRKWPMKGYS